MNSGANDDRAAWKEEEETGGMTEFIESKFSYSLKNARLFFKESLRGMNDAEVMALMKGKERVANMIYAGKSDNGDVNSGDGYRYRGRGLFHHTGRGNYRKLGGEDYVNNPDLILSTPNKTVKAAIDFIFYCESTMVNEPDIASF